MAETHKEREALGYECQVWGLSVCIQSQKTDVSRNILLISTIVWVFQTLSFCLFCLGNLPIPAPLQRAEAASSKQSCSTKSTQRALSFRCVLSSLQLPLYNCSLLCFTFTLIHIVTSSSSGLSLSISLSTDQALIINIWGFYFLHNGLWLSF